VVDLTKEGKFWWIYGMFHEIDKVFEQTTVFYTHAWSPSAWVVRGNELHYWACHCMHDKEFVFKTKGIISFKRFNEAVY